MEDADNPAGIPKGPKRKPGMIPSKKSAAVEAAAAGAVMLQVGKAVWF